MTKGLQAQLGLTGSTSLPQGSHLKVLNTNGGDLVLAIAPALSKAEAPRVWGF